MGFVRVDVITGAVMTGLIGLFIVVACAATLHASGRSIHDAADAAVALKPLAGSFASTLFGAGLLGAALLAASILPLATAYSVTEAVGHEAALDDSFAQARGFYLTYGLVVSVAVILVLIPGAPLISIMYLSQTLNAVLLVPLLWFIYRLCGDRRVMGSYVAGPQARVAYGVTIALLSCCVVTLGMLSLTG
jgi:Mn2+/Fe2+ NRAMP family transporter